MLIAAVSREREREREIEIPESKRKKGANHFLMGTFENLLFNAEGRMDHN